MFDDALADETLSACSVEVRMDDGMGEALDLFPGGDRNRLTDPRRYRRQRWIFARICRRRLQKRVQLLKDLMIDP